MPVNITDQRYYAPLESRSYRKYGLAMSVNAGEQRYIWPRSTETYPWPASAQITTISSTSSNDIGKQFVVFGLDGEGHELKEVITLTANPTTLVNMFFRINRVAVMGDVPNEGEVSVFHGSDELAVIMTGLSQTQQLIGTVPIDKTFLVSSLTISTQGNKGAGFNIFAREPYWPFILFDSFYLVDTSLHVDFNPCIRLKPLADYYMTTNVDSTGDVSATFMGYYHVNDEIPD